MFNSFKATLRRWQSLPLQDISNIFKWFVGDAIDFANRHLMVASANDSKGVAAYALLETTWVLRGYAPRPDLTGEAAQKAGDEMDSIIVREAKAQGIERVLFVLPTGAPPEPDEVCLRVIVRQVVPKSAAVPTNNQGIAVNPQTFIN
jgi:hypothetical protein